MAYGLVSLPATSSNDEWNVSSSATSLCGFFWTLSVLEQIISLFQSSQAPPGCGHLSTLWLLPHSAVRSEVGPFRFCWEKLKMVLKTIPWFLVCSIFRENKTVPSKHHTILYCYLYLFTKNIQHVTQRISNCLLPPLPATNAETYPPSE